MVLIWHRPHCDVPRRTTLALVQLWLAQLVLSLRKLSRLALATLTSLVGAVISQIRLGQAAPGPTSRSICQIDANAPQITRSLLPARCMMSMRTS